MSLKEIKAPLRQAMRLLRIAYHKTIDSQALPAVLLKHFDHLQIPKDKIISGYMAKGSELNILPLMESLVKQGYQLCLPIVHEDSRILSFRLWAPGLPLIEDAARVLVPSLDSEEVLPDVLLLPLIAFDKEGHRLGQGMGYFDGTLWHLSTQKPIITVGMAYEIQRLNSVPTKGKDYNLNYAITDKNLYHFSSGIRESSS